MKMYVDGQWVESSTVSPIASPYSGEVIDMVPEATSEQVEQALSAAEKAAVSMAKMTAYERGQILNRTADLLATNLEEIARTISMEEGKPITESRAESVQDGARIVTGGQREDAVLSPTIVADVNAQMRIFCEELFGPAVAVTPVVDVDEAISLTNDSKYGLGAGIFTRDLNTALRFARDVHTGNVMINWTPLWRADLMPHGGFKKSGIGKEGPRYAIQEMTDMKTVVFHGLDT